MKEVKTTDQTNPFEFEAVGNNSNPDTRKLIHTEQLKNISNARAIELINAIKSNPELHEPVKQMMADGDVAILLDIIGKTFSDEQFVEDSKFMIGASDDVLDRMLESRRSDRSKARAKGLKSDMNILVNWISSMYSELLIRTITGKAYNATQTTTDFDSSDAEAIKRRIKSLQSKKSRLNQLAQYNPDAKIEFEAVETEIARLNALRGTTSVTGKTALKNASAEEIRQALALVDVNSLSDEQQKIMADLMAKIG